MKYTQIINAKEALQKLIKMSFPAGKAYRIYLLSKKINEIFDFFIEEERKLISKFNAEVNDAGEITFQNAGDAENFRDAYVTLQNSEITEELSMIELTEADMKEQTLAPIDIFNLEGLVSFE